MVSAEYTLVELASAAGMTPRNVRAYRQRGLLDPPRLHGRRGIYGAAHLAQLRTVRALLARGLSLAEIGEAMSNRAGEHALELLLTEPTAHPGTAGLGTLMESTVETLALQRPGAAQRLTEAGVLRRGDGGEYLVDAGLLARANELLADGARVRVLADVGEAAAAGARQVADDLHVIADTVGAHEARRYLDLATWAFREALRHALSAPRP